MLWLCVVVVAMVAISGEESAEWVKRPTGKYTGDHITWDLQKYPLQVATNSPIGSGKALKVMFYDKADEYRGAVWIKILDPQPKYTLKSCVGESADWEDNLTDFPVAVEDDSMTQAKIWTFEKSATHFKISVNDKEVLEFAFADGLEGCAGQWSADFGYIMFSTQPDAIGSQYRAIMPEVEPEAPASLFKVDVHCSLGQAECFIYFDLPDGVSVENVIHSDVKICKVKNGEVTSSCGKAKYAEDENGNYLGFRKWFGCVTAATTTYALVYDGAHSDFSTITIS